MIIDVHLHVHTSAGICNDAHIKCSLITPRAKIETMLYGAEAQLRAIFLNKTVVLGPTYNTNNQIMVIAFNNNYLSFSLYLCI